MGWIGLPFPARPTAASKGLAKRLLLAREVAHHGLQASVHCVAAGLARRGRQASHQDPIRVCQPMPTYANLTRHRACLQLYARAPAPAPVLASGACHPHLRMHQGWWVRVRGEASRRCSRSDSSVPSPAGFGAAGWMPWVDAMGACLQLRQSYHLAQKVPAAPSVRQSGYPARVHWRRDGKEIGQRACQGACSVCRLLLVNVPPLPLTVSPESAPCPCLWLHTQLDKLCTSPDGVFMYPGRSTARSMASSCLWCRTRWSHSMMPAAGPPRSAKQRHGPTYPRDALVGTPFCWSCSGSPKTTATAGI